MAKLPKPKFNLRLPKSDTETLISLVFRYHGKRLVYSTGYSILPKDWDFRLQRPIMQTGRADLFRIKRCLDDLAAYCMDIFLGTENGPVSVEDFKRQLDINTGKISTGGAGEDDPGATEKRTTFFDFIDQEIAEMVASKMKQSSLKVFKRHTTILKEFAADVFPDTGSFDYGDVDWNFRLKPWSCAGGATVPPPWRTSL